MKYYTSQLPILINKIQKNEIKALLLYGPDRGYVNKICSVIRDKLSMISSSITYEEFAKNDLLVMLASNNFFGQRELLKIINVSNSLVQNVKNIPNHSFEHFPLFIGEELRVDSGVRKFFESEKMVASIGCYHDDEQNIVRLILKTLSDNKKKIENTALEYLKIHLKGDHNFVQNEIEKLLIYASLKTDQAKILLADVKEVLSDSVTSNGDELCIYFAKKDLLNFLKEANKLIEVGTSEVLIIKALIRYYTNIYIVLKKIEDSATLDAAVKSLTPPIFFKYILDFKNIILNTNTFEAIRILKVLQDAERDFKSNSANFDFYYNIYAKCVAH